MRLKLGPVALFFVAFFSFSGVAAAQQVPSLFDVANVASNDVLNIRARPDASSNKIGALAYDRMSIEVVSISKNGKWGLVNSQGMPGWVAMRFLRHVSAATQNLPAGLSCAGTEPFWGLSLQHDGLAQADWMMLGLPDGQQASVYNSYWSARPANRTDQTYAILLSSPATGANVSAAGIIRAEVCSDGMSDQAYGYSINLIIRQPNQMLVSGCCSLVPH